MKTCTLMLYGELMAVGSELLTKHTGTLLWWRVEFFNLKHNGIDSKH